VGSAASHTKIIHSYGMAVNLYGFVWNDGVNKFDVLGMKTIKNNTISTSRAPSWEAMG
jgi:hypothetical protein